MATQKYTRKELAEKNPKDGTVFIINNVVYNVTKFLDEHPGGHEVLVNQCGKDASEDWEDVGHSFDAKELMQKYVVGELVDEDRIEVAQKSSGWDVKEVPDESSFLSSWKVPLIVGLIITVLYSYLLG